MGHLRVLLCVLAASVTIPAGATFHTFDLLSFTEKGDTFSKTVVVPAKAGTQRRASNDTGFPLSRE
jgi:hypothetical protein